MFVRNAKKAAPFAQIVSLCGTSEKDVRKCHFIYPANIKKEEKVKSATKPPPAAFNSHHKPRERLRQDLYAIHILPADSPSIKDEKIMTKDDPQNGAREGKETKTDTTVVKMPVKTPSALPAAPKAPFGLHLWPVAASLQVVPTASGEKKGKTDLPSKDGARK